MTPRISVTIATRNRRDDLAHTLEVLAGLTPPPAEVLITADGCTDGTVEFVRENYPEHRLTVNDIACGSTGSRDAMFRRAQGEIILILDDDSHPVEPDFLARLPKIFEERPRLAVVHFPQRSDETPASLEQADFGPSCYVGTYVNCAAALRRSVFVALGGYPEQFRIAYDEPDFALRCVCAGWQVRYDTSLTVRHHYSGVQRNELRMHQAHARNELWSIFLRCPAPQWPAVALFRALRQFGYAWGRGWPWAFSEPRWWAACLAGVPWCLAQRRALPWPRYRAWMRLVRSPIYSEEEYASSFGAAELRAQAPPGVAAEA